jgi:hypothetical protein
MATTGEREREGNKKRKVRSRIVSEERREAWAWLLDLLLYCRVLCVRAMGGWIYEYEQEQSVC